MWNTVERVDDGCSGYKVITNGTAFIFKDDVLDGFRSGELHPPELGTTESDAFRILQDRLDPRGDSLKTGGYSSKPEWGGPRSSGEHKRDSWVD